MTEKRMPVAETQRETGTNGQPLQLAVSHNRPDTGLVPGPERVLTR